MATLVLTVVGGIVGGPIGAAIGSIAGQAIDRDVLFRPKGRQGPRLTDLRVQTSSYGTPIQKVFGTMRVAGCVIWSTDLIETRSTSRQGKGQPSLTSYSYAASFAVALSGRRIAGIGRIWADGNLLRGAAGDFKSACTFRFHPGDEAQAADPLIASLEGAGMTPAHRGTAYAVFENFALADYGNRIPSITFEVIGDDGAVDVGAMVAELSGGAVADGGVALAPAGYAAAGDSVRGAITPLIDAGGAWVAPAGDALVVRDAATAIAVPDAGYAPAGSTGTRNQRTLAPIETVPRTITLAHYDPARDYQTGVQRAERPGAGWRDDQIELPVALSADLAKQVAETALALVEAGRERRKVALGWSSLALQPGALVAIEGVSGLWRATGWSLEHMVLTLDCLRIGAAQAGGTATSGRALPAPDLATGTTILHAFELPALDDALLEAPRLMVAAAGTAPGWRRAALLYSLDGNRWESAGSTALPAVLGSIDAAPGAGSATLVDTINSVEVTFAHDAMDLANADADALDAGVNLALVGDELLQFARAEQLSPRHWRLSQLWRGRRGTEAAIGTQAPGDRFVLLERDALATIDLPLSALGSTVSVMASGLGDMAGPVTRGVAIDGASILPPSPVALSIDDISGDIVLRWTRRSRIGWRWLDGVDAPLGEEREAYRVDLRPAVGAALTLEVDQPTTIATANRAGGPIDVTVRQIGTHGLSPAATIVVPAL